MSAHVPHGQSVNAESVVPTVVALKAVVRNTIAVVTAALLPRAVLRLPAMSPIALPSDLLLAHIHRSALLGRPNVLLLTISLPWAVLLSSGLCLLIRRALLSLTALLLLILLRSGLLLLLSWRVVLFVLLRLPLMILLLPGYLLLLLVGTVPLLLSLCIFPALGLLTLLRLFVEIIFSLLLLRVLPSLGSLLLVLLVRCLFLILSSGTRPLFLAFSRLFLFLLLFLLLRFVLFILVRKSWNSPTEKQKYHCCSYDSNGFRHFVSSKIFCGSPLFCRLFYPTRIPDR